jgi:hypothetical protein
MTAESQSISVTTRSIFDCIGNPVKVEPDGKHRIVFSLICACNLLAGTHIEIVHEKKWPGRLYAIQKVP